MSFKSLWIAFAIATAALVAPNTVPLAHSDGLAASYYNSTDFSGTPKTRVDSSINFDWGNVAPVPDLNTDNFSIRWTGFVQAPATGTYTFYTTTDDGVRLWVNNNLIVDKWIGQPPTTWSAGVSLTAGQKVPIRMDYFESTGGAVAKLSWSGPGGASGIVPSANLLSSTSVGNGLSASYYNTSNLSGTPLSRVDPTVNFDWSSGSPASGINADNFSVRWTGFVSAPSTGTYTFSTTTDDGVRLWVNNTQLVDKWVGQPVTSWSNSISMTAGQKVPLKMEFFEATGGASAKLSWSGPSLGLQIIPQSNLFSGTGTSTNPFYTDNSLFGVNLAGGEFGPLPGTYGTDYGYPPAADLNYFKNKGRRIMRVPFKWERLQPTLNGPLSSTDLARLDETIANASTRGMIVILDCHNYGWRLVNGQWPSLGDPTLPNSAFADLWKRIAEHYATSNAVAYSLMNEPSGLRDDTRWPTAAQAAVDAIRTVDTVHTIFVCGDHQSGAKYWRTFNENLNINDPANNIVYEAHSYFDSDGSGRYQATYDSQGATPQTGVNDVTPFVQWCQAKGKRGFIGEFGVPNNDPRWLTTLDNFLAYLQANNIGGTYWAGGYRWDPNYITCIQPTNNYTTDRPTMGILQKYPG